jgi:hypothetical protein
MIECGKTGHQVFFDLLQYVKLCLYTLLLLGRIRLETLQGLLPYTCVKGGL